MYEHRSSKPLTRRQFARRVASHAAFSMGILLVSLGIGVIGYHYLGELAWVDALVNASMILSGMGPADPLHTTAAKIFASIYALFSGLVFIGAVSVLIAPFLHRLMHRFHIDHK